MKRKLVIFIFALFGFLWVEQPVEAQRSGAFIGKIDLNAVFLLHPSMIGYSPEKQAFRVKRNTVDKAKLNERMKASSDEVRRLESAMKRISAKLREEERNFSKKIDEYNKKYIDKITELATGEASMQKLNHKLAVGNAEALHNSKITALYAQYSEAEDKLMKITQFGFDEDYTTSDETEQRFNAIINEIRAYTQRIAEQKGISIVLNTSYKRSVLSEKAVSQDWLSDSYSLNAIFNTPFPSGLVKDEAAVAGYYNNISSLTQVWLRNCKPMANGYKNAALESDIFIGGVDLTAEVLTALFKAYKLDPNISGVVINSALSY